MASDNVIEVVIRAVDEATAPIKNVVGALDNLSRGILGLGIGQLAGITGLVAGMKLLVSESSEIQDATVRLDRTYKAFANTIGVSRESLAAFAETAQRTTRFSSAAVTEAQQRLIQFGRLSGDQLREAEKVMLDLGEQMGGNLPAAAMILSRALENPLQSSRLLRQAGVDLTAAQREQIKTWEATGQHAKTVAMMLDEVRRRTDGAAADAINTYSGALDHLKNSFKELFNQQGVLKLFTDGINAMANAISNLAGTDKQKAIDDIKKKLIELYAQKKKLDEDARIGGTLSPAGLKKALDTPGIDKAIEVEQIRLWQFQVDLLRQKNAIVAADEKAAAIAKITNSEADRAAAIAAHRAAQEAELGNLELFGLERGKIWVEYEKKKTEELQKQIDLRHAADVATRTDLEKEKAAWEKFQADLVTAKLAPEEMTKRTVAELDKVLAEVTLKSKHMYDKVAPDPTQMRMFKDLQSAFADLFMNIDNGWKGIAQTFSQMLKRMVAEALSADLMHALFGTGSGGNTNSIFSSIFSLFTGGMGGGGMSTQGRAAGGPVYAGQSYIVGEQGPELFRPSTSGTIIPKGGSGGGLVYAPTINVDARADRAQVQSDVQRAVRRGNEELISHLKRYNQGLRV